MFKQMRRALWPYSVKQHKPRPQWHGWKATRSSRLEDVMRSPRRAESQLLPSNTWRRKILISTHVMWVLPKAWRRWPLKVRNETCVRMKLKITSLLLSIHVHLATSVLVLCTGTVLFFINWVICCFAQCILLLFGYTWISVFLCKQKLNNNHLDNVRFQRSASTCIFFAHLKTNVSVWYSSHRAQMNCLIETVIKKKFTQTGLYLSFQSYCRSTGTC